MSEITRTIDEIIQVLNYIQDDALLADGCSCGLNYDLDDKQLWTDWLMGKVEI